MGQEIPDSRAGLVRQLRGEGIRDERLLAAMAKVRRELFVPGEVRHAAYADGPLPIGEGQTISQPYMVALMTEALAPRAGHRVLEIGTGSGYQTAILAELAARVVSLERSPILGERAARRLLALGYHDVSVHVADGTLGWAAEAPYDAILVTAGSPGVPQQLLAQLAEGGRLVIPVGTLDHQSLQLVIMRRGRLQKVDLGPCRFVPLVGKEGWQDES